jgi:hypothetical protein
MEKEEVNNNGSGGMLTFTFHSLATVRMMTLMDIDDPDEAVLEIKQLG